MNISLAGQAIGLEVQLTAIGAERAVDATSRGSVEPFIGFNIDAVSQDAHPEDFDPVNDTVTSSTDGVLRYSPIYINGQLSWINDSGLPIVLTPADQTIITVGMPQLFSTDPEDIPLTADGASIPNPWTPTQIDFNVAVAAGGAPNTIVVAETNKFGTIESWSTSYMVTTPNQPDPFGGNNAMLFTMNTSDGSAAQRLISKSGNPAMVAANGGFEIWAKPGSGIPILMIYPLDSGATHNGYIDLTTGETFGNFSRIRIVEKRDDGWVRIWFSTTQDAVCQTIYLYFTDNFLSNNRVWAGGETATLYAPRSADGELPFRQDQLARFYKESTVDHVDSWAVKNPFLDSEADNAQLRSVKVLLPDTYTPNKKYTVVYLPDVWPSPSVYGQPLDFIAALDLQNRYDVIVCWTDFKSIPWYGTKSDGTQMCDVYFSQALVGLIDQQYSTLQDPEHRLLFSFSKGGWGGLSMMLLRPETFGYAAAWDVPWDLQFGDFETIDAFGTEEQFKKYNPIDILPATYTNITDKPRFVLAGSASFEPQTVSFKAVLEGYGVPFTYSSTLIPGGGTSHTWNSGWIEGVFGDLMALIGR